MTKAAELAKMGEVITNSQIGGRRNIIINGACQVAQRSTSETGLGAASGYFTLDRYQILASGTAGRFTMSQTADGPSGFANCLKLQCTTADTSIAAGEYTGINYRIEGQDLQSLKKGTSDAEEITISFYVKGNASATYMLEVKDNDNTRINHNQFTVSTSWTRVEITLSADTVGAFDDDNTLSLEINFWLHGGSTYTSGTYTANTWAGQVNANRLVGISSFFDSTDRTFFLTGFQMEVGSVATPFEHKSFGEELSLCERYHQRFSDGDGTSSDTTNALFSMEYRQQMRSTPAFSLSAALQITNGYAWDKTQSSASVAIVASRVSASGVQIRFANFSSLTQYQPVAINNTGGDIIADAEL